MNCRVSPGSGSVNIVAGRDICRAKYLASKKSRLALAVRLTDGETLIQGLTSVQVGFLLDLNDRAIAAERQKRKPLSDKALAALIQRVGPSRLVDALDRITAPAVAS